MQVQFKSLIHAVYILIIDSLGIFLNICGLYVYKVTLLDDPSPVSRQFFSKDVVSTHSSLSPNSGPISLYILYIIIGNCTEQNNLISYRTHLQVSSSSYVSVVSCSSTFALTIL
jgi:hypothetical protein